MRHLLHNLWIIFLPCTPSGRINGDVFIRHRKLQQMTEPKNSNDDMIGRQLGQFTLLQEIGRGGMATVYSATQRSMNRTVAIKVLPRHFMHDPGFLERFEREVEVISHLEHPHILPIYDYGESDGVPYIAMRFLGGGSMAQMARRGVSRIENLVKPLTQIAEALDYAHQQGIIHRDLKPGNIMLDEHGNAYLSDFGIARVMGSNLTGSAIIGTPAYMSPEQAMGGAIDARSDIYALGVVLFELITGREPYQAETPMSVLLKHINEPMPPISDFRDNLPVALQSVIDKATAKNPDDRYSSATDMARAFGESLRSARPTEISRQTQHDSSPATVVDQVKRLHNQGGTLSGAAVQSPVQTAASVPAVDVVAATPPRSRKPLIAFALVALLVVVIGVVAVVLPMLRQPQKALIALPDGFERIETANYSIGIPRNMLPAVNDFIDESTPDRILHRWRRDEHLYLTVALVNADRVALDAYFQQYYASLTAAGASWQQIDEETAPNGTVRRSYRVENDAALSNGQIDLFFVQQNGYLVVVEMYASDRAAAEPDLIASLQTILDSLQITPEA
jgi:serine/threonine protein kinase